MSEALTLRLRNPRGGALLEVEATLKSDNTIDLHRVLGDTLIALAWIDVINPHGGAPFHIEVNIDATGALTLGSAVPPFVSEGSIAFIKPTGELFMQPVTVAADGTPTITGIDFLAPSSSPSPSSSVSVSVSPSKSPSSSVSNSASPSASPSLSPSSSVSPSLSPSSSVSPSPS